MVLGVLGVAAGAIAFFASYYVLGTQYGGGVHRSDLEVFGGISLFVTLGFLAIAYSVYKEPE
jgi:hypothetical protein